MPCRNTVLAFAALASGWLSAQQDPYREAVEAFQRKQYDQALVLADQALRTQKHNAVYLHLYGSVLAAMGRLDAAEEYLTKAAAAAPDQATYAYDLGTLLHNERKYPEAVPVLKRAVQMAPDNLVARMLLARCYVFSFNQLKLPNFVELTLEQLNYIVRKDPKFPAVHHHLALVYINTGDMGRAREELNTELHLNPENAQARLELGETLLKLNENQKAVDELETAARQAPNVPPIFYALGKAYRARGETNKAVDALRKCVELDPRFPTCHYMLGQLYRDLNQTEAADEQFDLFRQLKPPSGAAN